MSEPAMSAGTPRKNRTPRLSRAERGFKGHPMAQLTLVRFREFIREPEAVFWTFVFPILLAAGLGIAFRQQGLEQLHVGVVTRAGADTSVVAAMKRDSTLVLRTYDDNAGALALRSDIPQLERGDTDWGYLHNPDFVVNELIRDPKDLVEATAESQAFFTELFAELGITPG